MRVCLCVCLLVKAARDSIKRRLAINEKPDEPGMVSSKEEEDRAREGEEKEEEIGFGGCGQRCQR